MTKQSKGGRPSNYTPNLGDNICARLTNGESLESICNSDDMPESRTIYRWLREYDEFCQNYTRARDEQADTYADKIADISYKTLNGVYEANNARVAIDGLKWTASKLKPKKYGDKLDMTTGGEKIESNSIVFMDFKNDSASK